MLTTHPPPQSTEPENPLLETDERWALLQRILASEEFQRAAQLRILLQHVTKAAILTPQLVRGEYDLAVEVLGRRRDFDPADDNIVRSQFSQLRRKLAHYFDNEGKHESLVLEIPKRSYRPIFRPIESPEPAPLPLEPVTPPIEHIDPGWPPPPSVWVKVGPILLLLSIVLGLGVIWLSLNRMPSPAVKEDKSADGNAFLHFLSRSEGEVTVVIPDTSLVLIQQMIDKPITLSEYVDKEFPQNLTDGIADPKIRLAVKRIGGFRTTSVTEGMAAADVTQTLTSLGIHATMRYARDIREPDFHQGNFVLIGGPGSNPWTSLISEQMNFRQLPKEDNVGYDFRNMHPQVGEQPLYSNVYESKSGVAIGYVDIALTYNPTGSGYILIVNGADMQSAEAAVQFILHGKLTPTINAILTRKDLHSFELFLRGVHKVGEPEQVFELVATRSN